MSTSWTVTGLLSLISIAATAFAPSNSAAQDYTVEQYILHLQGLPPTQKVQSAVLTLFDQTGQPMEPELWPPAAFGNYQAFTIVTAACGVIVNFPVLLEQQAGAMWHRWCRDPVYPYARRDTYYFASGRLSYKPKLSLQRNCESQLELIPAPVQSVCE